MCAAGYSRRNRFLATEFSERVRFLTATYGLKKIASILDLSERRVQQLCAKDILPKTERGRYELEPVVKAYIHYLRDRSLGEGVVSLEDARKRKLNAEAELAEIQLAQARADVVSVEEVQSQWDSVLSSVRTRILAVPTKLAPRVSVETELATVKDIIEDGIFEALGEIARDFDEPDDVEKIDAPKNEAAAKTDDKRVGRPRKATKPRSE